MKTLLVVFHSMTGGTRQMASAAARPCSASARRPGRADRDPPALRRNVHCTFKARRWTSPERLWNASGRVCHVRRPFEIF